MCFAEQPLQLSLDDVIFKTITLRNDGAKRCGCGVVNRIKSQRIILNNKPNVLTGIRDKLRDMFPSITSGKINGNAGNKVLPPPTWLTNWHEMTQGFAIGTLSLAIGKLSKNLGGQTQFPKRRMNLVFYGGHGMWSNGRDLSYARFGV